MAHRFIHTNAESQKHKSAKRWWCKTHTARTKWGVFAFILFVSNEGMKKNKTSKWCLTNNELINLSGANFDARLICWNMGSSMHRHTIIELQKSEEIPAWNDRLTWNTESVAIFSKHRSILCSSLLSLSLSHTHSHAQIDIYIYICMW